MNRLIKAIKNGNVWSGYIINGGEISKAFEIASEMAKELNTAPYIIEEPDMDSIRGLISNLYGDIQSSEYKVGIIYADKLSVACQNALLKTIEEPYDNVCIIFISTNISVFLPTIISRCVMYNCPQDKIEDIEKETGNLLCARYSKNSLEKAKELENDPNFIKNRNRTVEILENLFNKRTTIITKEEKDFIKDYVLYMELFLTDVLKGQGYWFFDNKSLIEKYKKTFTFKQIISMIKIVINKQMEIMKNANNMFVFDSLQLAILEVIRWVQL